MWETLLGPGKPQMTIWYDTCALLIA